MTADEIMAKALSWTGGEYQEHFMWYSKWVDDKALLAFCKNGIRDAATLEELQDLSVYPENVYVRCHLSIWYKDDEGQQKSTSDLNRHIKSSDELIAYMDEAAERLLNRKSNEFAIHVCMEYPHEKAVRYPKADPPRRKKPERLDSDFWVILVKRKSGNDYFIQRLVSRQLRFAYTPDAAMQFKSQKAAEKWAVDRSVKVRFANIEALEYQYVA